MAIRIGTSGWSYDHWENVLYPHGTRPAARLELHTKGFTTVEPDASFYRWPGLQNFASWQRRLPEDFQMSVKAARGLTRANGSMPLKSGSNVWPHRGSSWPTAAECSWSSSPQGICGTTLGSSTSWPACPGG